MFNKKAKQTKTNLRAGTLISLVVIFATAWLAFNRQYVADYVAVSTFSPTESILSIEDKVDMTDRGVFLFRATQPQVIAADQFNESCQRRETNNPILGCFTGDRIFIYDIDNQDLTGIKEVTAAHEMLHVAWERLSQADRSKLDVLLRQAYEKLATDELKVRIGYYERNEPTEIVNELHSILATEFRDLGPELDEYYSKYFVDRLAVVAQHERYSGVFNGLVEKASSLQKQLETRKIQLESKTTSYEAAVANLSAAIQVFNGRAARGEFSSMSSFYSERSALVAQSNQLESERQSILTLVDEYNTMLADYQQTASQIDKLNQSIDSVKGPAAAPEVD
ncbi:hypothetical protein B7Y94_03775 [Candidatus Saccharibacteria bacterium 32-49-12]|nr:MAG: hypothetical protein B7Y94_03775 [Candidatus Saccharibacteria bacterium 32-49-12]